MGAQFERFLEKYISAWYIPEIKLSILLMIIIISVLVYEIMVWIKNTKAWMLLKGMLVLCAFILVAAIFEMKYHFVLGEPCDRCAGDGGSCCLSARASKGT